MSISRSLVLFSVILYLIALNFSCSGKFSLTKNNDDNKSTTNNGSSQKTDTDTDKDPEVPPPADRPTMITGSWLTCGPVNELKKQYGCAYLSNDNTKFEGRLEEWTITIVSADQRRFKVTDLTQASPDSIWHVLFDIPSELLDQLFVIEGSVKVEGSPQTALSSSCPQGYILVFGDVFYKTSDFCVMKYEAKMKEEDGKTLILPLPDGKRVYGADVNLDKARELCNGIGQGYALISNEEWMTIAVNIAQNPHNWSGQEVGKGAINRGHSDKNPAAHLNAEKDDNPCFGTLNDSCNDPTHVDWSQKRTHELINGEIMWDLAGNEDEFVDKRVEPGNMPSPHYSTDRKECSDITENGSVVALTELRPTSATHSWWQDSWNSAQGLGTCIIEPTGADWVRGDCNWHDEHAGIFSIKMVEKGSTDGTQSFRCSYHK